MEKVKLSMIVFGIMLTMCAVLATAQTVNEDLNSLNHTKTKQAPENLESVLYQLVKCQDKDKNEFAEAHGLYLKDDKVRVIIELKDKKLVFERDDIVIETRYENLVQALVPLDNLILLSEDDNVSYIRTPLPTYPQQSETQIPLTLIWTCVGIIVVIIIIVLYSFRYMYSKKKKGR